MVISFCGLVRENSGTSLNAASTAIADACLYNKNNIIIHIKESRNKAVEMTGENNILNNNSGIDTLIRECAARKNIDELLFECIETIWKGRLSIITGPIYDIYDFYGSGVSEHLLLIIKTLKKYFDNIFIITNIQNKTNVDELCDRNYLCMLQSVQDIKLLTMNNLLENYTTCKNKIIVGRFDNDSAFDINAVRRLLYKTKIKEVYAVPYFAEALDSSSAGRIVDFIIQNIESEKEDYSYQFISSIKKIVASFEEDTHGNDN